MLDYVYSCLNEPVYGRLDFRKNESNFEKSNTIALGHKSIE